MIKCFFSFSALSRSSLSSIEAIPLFLRRGRHCFLGVYLSVCHVIPGHWETVISTRWDGWIVPYRTGDIFKRGAHARITRLRNGAISGRIFTVSEYLVIIPGHCMISPGHGIISPGHGIISPGHRVILLRCWGVTGRNTRWPAAIRIVYPKETTLM